jgi:hypothetical protein
MKKIKTKKLSFKKGTVTELNNIEMVSLNGGGSRISTQQTQTQTGPIAANSLLCQ